MLPDNTPPATPSPSSFVRRVVITIGIALVALLFVWLFQTAMSVLLMAFAAILIAILLDSLAEPLRRFLKLGRAWSIVIVSIAFIGAGFGLGAFVVPSFAREIDELATTLPEQTQKIETKIMQYRWGRMLLNQSVLAHHSIEDETGVASSSADPTDADDISEAAAAAHTGDLVGAATQPMISASTQPSSQGDRLARTVQAAARPLVNGAGLLAAGVLNALLSLFIVIAAGMYLALDPRTYTGGLTRLFPETKRPQIRQTLHAMHYSLRWWLIAQGITMVVIGVLTGAGLWLIGVRLWLTFAILAAIFNFVPNFGPLISFVPAILFALADPEAGQKVFWISILYVVAQTFEGYILTPLVQKKAVDTPPALLILFQLLAGVTMGALGLMLAAPLLAAIVVAVKLLYIRAALGDRDVDVEGSSD